MGRAGFHHPYQLRALRPQGRRRDRLRRGSRRSELAKRELPEEIFASRNVQYKPAPSAGQGHVDTWKPWAEEATATEKLDILRQQSEELSRRIDDLRSQADRDRGSTQKGIREAENRLAAGIRQVGLELSGERRQASHVDARGLLPVGLGIVLTGLPDELAKVPALGGLVVAAAAISIACVFRGWLRDLHQALKTIGTEGGPELGTPDHSEVTNNNQSNISQEQAPAPDSNGDSNGSDQRQATTTDDSA
jgi:hypothetical protein